MTEPSNQRLVAAIDDSSGIKAAALAVETAKLYRKSDRRQAQLALGVGLLSIAAMLTVWEVMTRLGVIDPVILVPPTRVLQIFWRQLADGTLPIDLLLSTYRVLIGFLISAVAAITLGVVLGMSRVAQAMFDPILSIIRPLPSLAWIPLAIMWFGIGEKEKYAIVFMGTFAPLLVLVIDAVERVDVLYVKAARNLGASHAQVIKEVILPGALPSIMSGLKLALAISWACIISAEMVGATSGLGFLIWVGKDYGDIGRVIVGMLVISATVVVIDALFAALNRMLVPWLRNVRT